MPCAGGSLCTLPGLTLEPPDGHFCRRGCGSRLDGVCGEVEGPDGDNLVHRICSGCVDTNSFTKDTTTASAKRLFTDKEGRGAGSSKSGKYVTLYCPFFLPQICALRRSRPTAHLACCMYRPAVFNHVQIHILSTVL